VTEVEVLAVVAQLKAAGKRIVLTNGCFDILHPGHVSYLSEAATLGDVLIVAVNNDASVSRLKGDDRPVNNLDARMSVLAGLRSVSYVVPFSEDTPARLIEAVTPDVLVKGGRLRRESNCGARTRHRRGWKGCHPGLCRRTFDNRNDCTDEHQRRVPMSPDSTDSALVWRVRSRLSGAAG
jgi:D-beta-D-heptose 7-phosphate kinase/D-beta-D-heptose 1-phosphate adenosyltransferase